MAAQLLLVLTAASAGVSGATTDRGHVRRARDLARDTLAWVGERGITAADLVERTEMMPWPEKAMNADSSGVRALRSLVAEQLLAQEAERQGLGATGYVARAREALRKALARDALYREVAKTGTPAEFMARFLGGQRATVDSATFLLLADTLRSLVAAERRETGSAPAGVGEYADALLERLAPSLERPLVRLPGGPFRLGQAIETLRFYSFTVRARAPRAFAAELSAQLKQVVEGELLAREALRRRLDQRQDVRHDLEQWTASWRAQLLLERTITGPLASDDQAFRQFALFDPDRARVVCEVDVAEILIGSQDAAMRLRNRLDAGADFDSLARRFTQRAEWSARGGRSGYFPISQHPLLGYAALLATRDSLQGPIRLREGFTLFRVLGKRIAPDSLAAQSLLEQARMRATATARAADISRYVATLASRSHVRFDDAALSRVDVASVTVLTKRRLGFGGGMIAAPPLMVLWDWVRLWGKPPTALP